MDAVSDTATPPVRALPGDLRSALDALPGARVDEGARLADHTTLRIGGRPRAYVECTTPEAVAGAVRLLDDAGVPVLVLGGGSNLVVAAGDLDLVVVAVRDTGVRFGVGDDAGNGAGDARVPVVRAGAGVEWDRLVAETVAHGYGGLECLSGIPGSVGATPVQNVGAYGVEVAQVLDAVRLWDRHEGVDRWVAPDELGLGYRTSMLKNTDRAVVLEVDFRLSADGLGEPIRYAELARVLGVEPGERLPAPRVREAVLGLRAGKGMVLDSGDHDTWSAGSFFTNPVVEPAEAEAVRARVEERLGAEVAAAMPAFTGPAGVKLSAGWLIERAGFSRGFPDDDAPARLSTKHTLALTNRGTATADDIIALARRVRDGVWSEFGVRLHPEPVWVGCAI